jgi:Zn-dependent protease
MFRSFSLGSVFGFPVRINLSFLLLLAIVSFTIGMPQGLILGLVVAASVLVHELGHALVARRRGVAIAGIELHFFGGAAQMVGMPRTPMDEIVIAAAGPAVSLALAALFFGLGALTGATPLLQVAAVNLGLGVFNLLPAFPSDGGRILRAWLAQRRGLVAATDVAVKVSRVVCVGLVVLAIATQSFMPVVVAGVLWLMGSAERVGVRLRGDGGAWRGKDAPPLPVIEAEYIPPSVRAPRVVIWRS